MSLFYEEFEVGHRYPTYSRTVTEADVVLFCSLVGYHVPLFIDEHFAKGTRFGGRIAPSALIMSFSTAMTESYFRTTVIAHVSSTDAVFHAPVRLGDTIATEFEVVSMQSSNDRSGRIVFRDRVTNQDGVLVYSVDKLSVISKRPVAI